MGLNSYVSVHGNMFMQLMEQQTQKSKPEWNMLKERKLQMIQSVKWQARPWCQEWGLLRQEMGMRMEPALLSTKKMG